VIKTPAGEEIHEPHCAAPVGYATGTKFKHCYWIASISRRTIRSERI